MLKLSIDCGDGGDGVGTRKHRPLLVNLSQARTKHAKHHALGHGYLPNIGDRFLALKGMDTALIIVIAIEQ